MNETFRKTDLQITDQFGSVNLVFWLYDADQRKEIGNIVRLAETGLFNVDLTLSLHLPQDTRYGFVDGLSFDQFGSLIWKTREYSETENKTVFVNHILPASSFDKLCVISLSVRK